MAFFLSWEHLTTCSSKEENWMEQNEYFNDLAKIKETITENRNKAMVVVNSAMIITYY